jgi:alginate O-acetyltransferase complex protein AlgI
MLFVEFRFLEFFAVVFSIYWILQSNTLRKALLLIASYFFYASFFFGAEPLSTKTLPPGWWFPVLLAASTSVDFFIGLLLDRTPDGASRRIFLCVSLVVNIGVLVYFKYAGFLLESVGGFLAWLGLPSSPHTLKILLPVGLSFYTFQSMGYTIEVYRRHRPAERKLLNLATFVAFFPQLVAGPIVRAAAFLPQLDEKRNWQDVDVRGALVQFMGGFVKKAVVSNGVEPFVDQYFANPYNFDSRSAIAAVLLYAVQIYCDFSGYTDMAIACARLLGYELTPNFNFPYFSTSVADFWRRWHISLSTWLRDYLYISLGGSRGSKAFVCRNLLVTMILGGLWHGSRWTFLIWGALHGVALIVHRSWAQITAPWKSIRESPIASMVFAAATFCFVCICWIFFRSADLAKPMSFEDLSRAMFILKRCVGWGARASRHVRSLDPRLFIVFAGLALVHWLNFRRVFATWWRRLPAPLFALGYGCLSELILLFMPVKYAPFIYFQF